VKFGNTILNSITRQDSKILVVENDEVDYIRPLIPRITGVEIWRCCFYSGYLGRLNKVMMDVLDVPIDGGGKSNAVTRYLDSQNIGRTQRAQWLH